MQNPPSKPKLKPEVKKLWTEALKSGKYTQGTKALCNVTNKGFTHCCLGVLCDLHRIKIAKKGLQVWKNSVNKKGSLEYLQNVGVLPLEVVRWAFKTPKGDEVAHSNPDVEHEDGTCLSQINDKGCTFEQIAEVIEKQL